MVVKRKRKNIITDEDVIFPRKRRKRNSFRGTGASKLNALEEMKFSLSKYLSVGLTLDEACKLSECSKNVLGILRSDPEFEDFVKKCEARNVMEHLDNIKRAGSSFWQASAWFLERTMPDRFGKKDIVRHEYSVKLQTFQKIVLNVLEGVDPSLKLKLIQKMREHNLIEGQVVPVEDEDNCVVDVPYKETSLQCISNDFDDEDD